jgi:pimeloyl-ACP methyl ester carboxylesterase
MDYPIVIQDRTTHPTFSVLAQPAEPTDRLVVLCHGFLSNKNSSTNKALTRLLAEKGIATLRFDFFGHGESPGPFGKLTVDIAVSQACAALDFAASRGYRRLGLIGSSFGGLVAVLVAARRSDLLALGLKCPVPDFPEMLRLEFGEAGINRWRQRDEIPDVTGGARPVRLHFAFYEHCLAHDAYKAAESITAPTLIVQGDCDEYVPLHQSRRLSDALQGEKDLQILRGADHGFTKGDDFRTMTALLAEWMVPRLKSDSAGAEPLP